MSMILLKAVKWPAASGVKNVPPVEVYSNKPSLPQVHMCFKV